VRTVCGPGRPDDIQPLGKAVYTYSSGGERTIYIDWNGVDDSGNEVVAGCNYYIARVIFNSVDPDSSTDHQRMGASGAGNHIGDR